MTTVTKLSYPGQAGARFYFIDINETADEFGVQRSVDRNFTVFGTAERVSRVQCTTAVTTTRGSRGSFTRFKLRKTVITVINHGDRTRIGRGTQRLISPKRERTNSKLNYRRDENDSVRFGDKITFSVFG